MWFFGIENPRVRFGAVLENRKSYGAVRFGAVRFCDISYGAGRCGFQKSEILRCGSARFSKTGNPTIRFGAVLKTRKSYGAVRFCDVSYGPGRFGSPLSRFFYGAIPIPVQNKTYNTRFPLRCTVYINRTKTAVSYGSQTFYRGTNETAKTLYGAPYE